MVSGKARHEVRGCAPQLGTMRAWNSRINVNSKAYLEISSLRRRCGGTLT